MESKACRSEADKNKPGPLPARLCASGEAASDEGRQGEHPCPEDRHADKFRDGFAFLQPWNGRAEHTQLQHLLRKHPTGVEFCFLSVERGVVATTVRAKRSERRVDVAPDLFRVDEGLVRFVGPLASHAERQDDHSGSRSRRREKQSPHRHMPASFAQRQAGRGRKQHGRAPNGKGEE